MTNKSIFRRVVGMSVGVAALLTGCAAPQPRPEPIADQRVKNLSRSGDIYVSGAVQPDALADLRARGVQTIVDFRLPEQVPAEYPGQVRAAGLDYVHLPMRSDQLSESQADAFVAEISKRRGQSMLLQCGSSNRSGAMFGVYSAMQGGTTVDAALENARAAGLKDATLTSDVREYLERHAPQAAQPE